MSLSTANRSESCLHAWANRGLFEAPIESRCDALFLLLGRRTTQLQSVCRILYVHVCLSVLQTLCADRFCPAFELLCLGAYAKQLRVNRSCRT